MSLKLNPPTHPDFKISFPTPKILLLTLTRPQKLNCISLPTSRAIAKVWESFDSDPTLWVAIITGSGRAFCTGADLAEWNSLNNSNTTNSMSAPGLAGLPRRSGKKPIIAAINGITMGGGLEMTANCDIVIASHTSIFSLPEASRGIVPVAGCLPRLVSTLGLQRTMDLVLTGRVVDARTMEAWGLVTRVVEADVVGAATAVAEKMCEQSPDALIVGRLGVRMAWEGGSVEDKVEELAQVWYLRLVEGQNFKEGIRAFVEKRPTKWVDSKL